MTTYQIMRKAIPDADDQLCEFIVWERTAYPLRKLTTRGLYKTARRWRRTKEKGLRLCELCDRIAILGDSLCERCKVIAWS